MPEHWPDFQEKPAVEVKVELEEPPREGKEASQTTDAGAPPL